MHIQWSSFFEGSENEFKTLRNVGWWRHCWSSVSRFHRFYIVFVDFVFVDKMCRRHIIDFVDNLIVDHLRSNSTTLFHSNTFQIKLDSFHKVVILFSILNGLGFSNWNWDLFVVEEFRTLLVGLLALGHGEHEPGGAGHVSPCRSGLIGGPFSEHRRPQETKDFKDHVKKLIIERVLRISISLTGLDGLIWDSIQFLLLLQLGVFIYTIPYA